jgi:hypothetical protein
MALTGRWVTDSMRGAKLPHERMACEEDVEREFSSTEAIGRDNAGRCFVGNSLGPLQFGRHFRDTQSVIVGSHM